MLSTPLFFGTTLRWSLTLNEQLKSHSVMRFWDRGRQEYVYLFTIDKLSIFESLVKSVLFDEGDLVAIMHHTKQEISNVHLLSWKGKSGYRILEFPKIYRVISYLKSNKGALPRRTSHDVPRERVLRLWKNVIKDLPYDEPFYFEELAEKVCKEFGFKRFFKESGYFQKDKFQGSRGEAYFPYYYYPLKVLQELELISYVGQVVTRIKSSWDEQTSLRCDDYVADEVMLA